MERLDRLGWAAGISFTAYGVRVGVRVNEPRALTRLYEHFPPTWKPSPSPLVERLYSVIVGGAETNSYLRRFNLLYADAARLARTRDEEQVLQAFDADLQLYVAEAARRRVFVHAGVVGWQSKAIVIPGKTLSGKTTLVAELVRAGATYYSDEYAVLDYRGRVHPYLSALSLRSAPNAKPQHHRIEALGGIAGDQPLPVGLIIVSEYRAGARWRPQQLSAGQGALELLAHTVSARRQPERVLATLGNAVANAVALKSVRGEAREVAQAILEEQKA